jgi:hypothetical protein
VLPYAWVGLDHNSLYFYFLCNWDDRGTPPGEMGSREIILWAAIEP